jgi:hypothetical protein
MAAKLKKSVKAPMAKEKKSAKPAPKAAKGGAPAGKAGKMSAKAAHEDELVPQGPSADEVEEAEEQAEEAAASSSSSGGNAAALAAASGATEMSASFKNFRHHPDMENFYRFIFDNDLRHEALAILDEMMLDKQRRRAMKSAKASAH